MNAPPASTDPNFYINGAKRMVAEGLEAASKLMAYMKQHEETLNAMDPADRKKKLVEEFEPAKTFNQVHPIVFQYLTEGVFNSNAFRRYVISVYGKEKSPEDQEKLRGNRKYTYQYKNAQYALYYKYLLIELNPQADKTAIHKMYEEAVASLNAETDKMLDAYEKAQEDAKLVEAELTEEKRKDLVELLKKNINHH